jgi:hypothetical protein
MRGWRTKLDRHLDRHLDSIFRILFHLNNVISGNKRLGRVGGYDFPCNVYG